MQQYARNDECRLFRFASKLVFFLPSSYNFFCRQIFASLFNSEPGHLGQHIQTRKNPPLTFQKCKSDKLYLLPSMQSFVYLFFLVQFQQFCCIFYVLTFVKRCRQFKQRIILLGLLSSLISLKILLAEIRNDGKSLALKL